MFKTAHLQTLSVGTYESMFQVQSTDGIVFHKML